MVNISLLKGNAVGLCVLLGSTPHPIVIDTLKAHCGWVVRSSITSPVFSDARVPLASPTTLLLLHIFMPLWIFDQEEYMKRMWSNLLCWISAKAKMASHEAGLMADRVRKSVSVHSRHVLWKTKVLFSNSARWDGNKETFLDSKAEQDYIYMVNWNYRRFEVIVSAVVALIVLIHKIPTYWFNTA